MRIRMCRAAEAGVVVAVEEFRHHLVVGFCGGVVTRRDQFATREVAVDHKPVTDKLAHEFISETCGGNDTDDLARRVGLKNPGAVSKVEVVQAEQSVVCLSNGKTALHDSATSEV